LIKISDVANPDVYDISPAPFTLCQLELTNPTGFGFFRVGSPVDITWNSDLVGDLTLAYKLSIDDDWVVIDDGVPSNNNSYTWIPEEGSDWCKVRITETDYPDVYDESEGYFILFELDLTSPQGGELLTGNDLFDISWESEIISTVRIEFSSDNGQNWTTVESSTGAGNTPYSWTVPNINSDMCFIKITTPSFPEFYSINETEFSITEFTGVADQDNLNTDISLFPNPVNDILTIELANPEFWVGYTKVVIFNSQGKKVYNHKFDEFSMDVQKADIEVGILAPGLYTLKLINDNRAISTKFIKD